MNNIMTSRKNGNFVTMETVTFSLRSSEKKSVCLNHSNYLVKTDFFKTSSRTLILATYYSSMQSHSKIGHNLTMLFIVYFLYRKS